MVGGIQADQSISFQLMRRKLTQFVRIIGDDPAVASVVGFTGGGQTNSGFVFISLKPLGGARRYRPTRSWRGCGPSSRRSPAPGCSCRRCRTSASAAAPATRSTSTPCRATTSQQLYEWVPKITAALEQLPQLTDVNSDQQQKGLRDRPGHRSRHRGPARRHAWRRSTIRSTMLSGSGRCRRSTRRATSTTSSWRWRRNTGRARTP